MEIGEIVEIGEREVKVEPRPAKPEGRPEPASAPSREREEEPA